MKQIIDPFSEVMSALDLVVQQVGSVSLAGSTSLRFPDKGSIKFLVVVSGQGSLIVGGVPSVIILEAGDCVVLPRGTAHSLTCRCVDKSVISYPEGSNDHAGCFLVSGEFLLMSSHAEAMFRSVLPPLIHRRNREVHHGLTMTLSRLINEVKHPQPGSALMTQCLATIMFMQILRCHVEEFAITSVGWLFALADDAMAVALTRIHEAPGHRWSLQELARHAGLSRSTFAKRFKNIVGVTPMEYLTRWRMILAGARLTSSSEPVSRIASSFGYESENAFGKVFRNIMGASPAKYRRACRKRAPRGRIGHVA